MGSGRSTLAQVVDRASLVERIALAGSRLGLAPPPFPAPLFDAYFGAIAARAISAAGEAGVFEALAEAPASSRELAERTAITEDGADALLAALTTLGLVRHRRGQFALRRSTRRWTVQRTPTWTGAFGAWAHETASNLPAALRGASPTGLHERAPDDPFWTTYQDAMAELATFTAEPVAAAIPLQAPRRLLDLAGGPGLHAAALVRRHPSLEATVVELPGASARAPRQPGVEYREGDLFQTDLGSGYDVVTAHNLLHSLLPDRCGELMRLTHQALRPGGTLAVLELERPPPGRRGTHPATVGSLLFLVTGGTRTWTAKELEAFADEAGFGDVRCKRPAQLNGSVLLLARRS